MNEILWNRRIRNLVGFLGMILPWLALFSAGIAQHPANSWWYSISATYYQSPALVGILTAASIVLMTYDGYELIDNIITTISGVFGLCIILFPCNVSWIENGTKVGFFQLSIEYSNTIHCICAAIFFILLAYNSFFLFTKTNTDSPTRAKKIKNIIYRICGVGMFLVMIVQVLSVILHWKGYWTMINEIFLLQFFGISWLVKGNVFNIFKEEKVFKNL